MGAVRVECFIDSNSDHRDDKSHSCFTLLPVGRHLFSMKSIVVGHSRATGKKNENENDGHNGVHLLNALWTRLRRPSGH